jgi:hypothetical protein
MIFGVISLLLTGVLIYFAVIGIKVTVEKHPDLHGALFIRDFFKYLALFIAVLITCFGISGILTYILNFDDDYFTSKLDLARWMSFVLIGLPLSLLIAQWVRKEFRRDAQAKSSPVWHIYLLLATSTSLLLWFLPLQSALRSFAGAPYSPRSVSSAAVAFLIWVIHINLIRGYSSITLNVQFLFGSFVGFIGVALSLISFLDFGISTLMNLDFGKYQVAEAIILLITAFPLALYYFGEFGSRASVLEMRIFSTFGGLVSTILFVSVAATLSLNTLLVWYFGDTELGYERFFSDVPAQLGAILVLTIFHFIFRSLTEGYKRDALIRIYQYLISGATLIAGSIGFGAVMVALLADVNRLNTLLFGVSLMTITCSNWLYHWRLCQAADHQERELEGESPIRRFYLYFFIGAPIIFGIGSLVWLTFNGFKWLLLGNQALWQSRYPLAALATTILLSSYHLVVLRQDRASL